MLSPPPPLLCSSLCDAGAASSASAFAETAIVPLIPLPPLLPVTLLTAMTCSLLLFARDPDMYNDLV